MIEGFVSLEPLVPRDQLRRIMVSRVPKEFTQSWKGGLRVVSASGAEGDHFYIEPADVTFPRPDWICEGSGHTLGEEGVGPEDLEP